MQLAQLEWTENPPGNGLRSWFDPAHDVLSLAVLELDLWMDEFSKENALRKWARALAEQREAGLIETGLREESFGPAISLIYKRREVTASIYTGMLFIPGRKISRIWTVVAGERNETGFREAIVTDELLGNGRLDFDDYERVWARDPYDPAYSGVDRGVMRFLSDDPTYDEQFPWHPLSKVRRVLDALPGASFVVSDVVA